MKLAVSVEEAKNYLRIDEDVQEDDEIIEQFLTSAQTAAEDFCRVEFDQGAAATVKAAILLHASYYYENREATDNVMYHTMLDAFTRLLYPYRNIDLMF